MSRCTQCAWFASVTRLAAPNWRCCVLSLALIPFFLGLGMNLLHWYHRCTAQLAAIPNSTADRRFDHPHPEGGTRGNAFEANFWYRCLARYQTGHQCYPGFGEGTAKADRVHSERLFLNSVFPGTWHRFIAVSLCMTNIVRKMNRAWWMWTEHPGANGCPSPANSWIKLVNRSIHAKASTFGS
jgi:hypothetical protein